MGFLDKAKDTARQAVDKGGKHIGSGIDRGAAAVGKKTGRTGQADSGAEKIKDALDGLDGKNDDIR